MNASTGLHAPEESASELDVTSKKEILCATDFTAAAEAATEVAAALAARQGSALRLLHCAPDWARLPEATLAEPINDILRERLRSEQRRLGKVCEPIISELRHGGAAREVAARVDDNTDLIVMGSSAQGLAARWSSGSVAERVAEHASKPTLVVRRGEPLLRWLNQKQPLRVLCAVDFTVSADAAIATFKTISTLGGDVQFEAAYIAEADDLMQDSQHGSKQDRKPVNGFIDLERDIWERLHELMADLPSKVHVRIVHGKRADEFVRLGEERGADLLVVGTHQKHGLRRLMDPSFSRGVLSHAATNVLCVPVASYKPEFQVPQTRRVLVATDFSDYGNAALRHAYGLLSSGGQIKIIHVCAGVPSGEIGRAISSPDLDAARETAKNEFEAKERIKSLIPHQLSTSNIKVTSEVLVSMDTAGAICEAARSFGADVICMGSRASSKLGKMLTGSTCQSVIAQSHIPVFAVTPPKP